MWMDKQSLFFNSLIFSSLNFQILTINFRYLHVTRHFTRGEMQITKEKLGSYNDGKEVSFRHIFWNSRFISRFSKNYPLIWLHFLILIHWNMWFWIIFFIVWINKNFKKCNSKKKNMSSCPKKISILFQVVEQVI